MTECIRRPMARWTICRCEPCRRDQNRLEKLLANGVLPRASSAAAWDKVFAYLDAGWTISAIASACGLTDHFLETAMTVYRSEGHKRRFGHNAAARILGPWQPPTRGHIPAIGSARRLQALSVLGWTMRDVADLSGLPPMTLSKVRSGTLQRCRPRTVSAITAIYDRLYMQVPEIRKRGTGRAGREWATRQGWAAPLAWDDDTIDDPNARPFGATDELHKAPGGRFRDDSEAADDIAVERAITARSIKVLDQMADRIELVRRCHASGLCPTLRDLRREFLDLGHEHGKRLWALAFPAEEDAA